jgi:diguanylate cyclase (GGDEF)-like protein
MLGSKTQFPALLSKQLQDYELDDDTVNVLTSFLLPAAIIVLASLLYSYVGDMTQSQQFAAKLTPLALAVLAVSFGLRFNRSRIFFLTLVVSAIYITQLWVLPGMNQHQGLYAAICLLAPFNFLVLPVLKERGVFSVWGGSRFLFLVAQALLLLWMVYQPASPLTAYVLHRFIEHDAFSWTPLPQPALAVMIAALLLLNGRLFAMPNVQHSAFFGALICVMISLHFQVNEPAVVVFTGAAMLMMVIAVIQDSYSMAYIDQLTGLPGRRALNEHMLKLHGDFSIAMLDVDHFKKFNDSHGHDVGDQVLRMVASRMKEIPVGKAFRYGGEEFCILFPGRQSLDVMDDLEELRSRIAASPFDLRRSDRRQQARRRRRKRNVSVTISIGVANRNDKTSDPWEVLKIADKALYRAKNKGRNRVVKAPG